MSLLDLKNLSVSFATRRGVVQAVREVSLTLEPGEIVGIVGESGSGKSVLCQSLMGLNFAEQTRLDSYTFSGQDMRNLSLSRWQKIRGAQMSFVFQDPMSSLNPFLTIGHQLVEPLLLHFGIKGEVARIQGIEALEQVGITEPVRRFDQYPHELSGGMRQRVMIAMALITKPKLLIADEPTTALDVSVQNQILNILRERVSNLGTAVIFVTHDLSIVTEFCHRACVMYAGSILEEGPVTSVFSTPQHPYTEALKRSLPAFHHRGEVLKTISGVPADLMHIPEGCVFSDRCGYSNQECCVGKVQLLPISGIRKTACVRIQNGEKIFRGGPQ
jgi:oligopeptide transport system ATP-binding protein